MQMKSGALLKKRRLEKGITIVELADVSNVSQKSILDIEKCIYEPDDETVKNLYESIHRFNTGFQRT